MNTLLAGSTELVTCGICFVTAAANMNAFEHRLQKLLGKFFAFLVISSRYIIADHLY